MLPLAGGARMSRSTRWRVLRGLVTRESCPPLQYDVRVKQHTNYPRWAVHIAFNIAYYGTDVKVDSSSIRNDCGSWLLLLWQGSLGPPIWPPSRRPPAQRIYVRRLSCMVRASAQKAREGLLARITDGGLASRTGKRQLKTEALRCLKLPSLPQSRCQRRRRGKSERPNPRNHHRSRCVQPQPCTARAS